MTAPIVRSFVGPFTMDGTALPTGIPFYDMRVPDDMNQGDLLIICMAGYSSISAAPSFGVSYQDSTLGTFTQGGSATNTGLEDSMVTMFYRTVTNTAERGAWVRITGAGAPNNWTQITVAAVCFAFVAQGGSTGGTTFAGGAGVTTISGANVSTQIGGLVVDAFSAARRTGNISGYTGQGPVTEILEGGTTTLAELAVTWMLATATSTTARTGTVSNVGSAFSRNLVGTTAFNFGAWLPDESQDFQAGAVRTYGTIASVPDPCAGPTPHINGYPFGTAGLESTGTSGHGLWLCANRARANVGIYGGLGQGMDVDAAFGTTGQNSDPAVGRSVAYVGGLNSSMVPTWIKKYGIASDITNASSMTLAATLRPNGHIVAIQAFFIQDSITFDDVATTTFNATQTSCYTVGEWDTAGNMVWVHGIDAATSGGLSTDNVRIRCTPGDQVWCYLPGTYTGGVRLKGLNGGTSFNGVTSGARTVFAQVDSGGWSNVSDQATGTIQVFTASSDEDANWYLTTTNTGFTFAGLTCGPTARNGAAHLKISKDGTGLWVNWITHPNTTSSGFRPLSLYGYGHRMSRINVWNGMTGSYNLNDQYTFSMLGTSSSSHDGYIIMEFSESTGAITAFGTFDNASGSLFGALCESVYLSPYSIMNYIIRTGEPSTDMGIGWVTDSGGPLIYCRRKITKDATVDLGWFAHAGGTGDGPQIRTSGGVAEAVSMYGARVVSPNTGTVTFDNGVMTVPPGVIFGGVNSRFIFVGYTA